MADIDYHDEPHPRHYIFGDNWQRKEKRTARMWSETERKLVALFHRGELDEVDLRVIVDCDRWGFLDLLGRYPDLLPDHGELLAEIEALNKRRKETNAR